MNQNIIQEPILINGIEMYLPMEEEQQIDTPEIPNEIISQTPLNQSKITQSMTPDNYLFSNSFKEIDMKCDETRLSQSNYLIDGIEMENIEIEIDNNNNININNDNNENDNIINTNYDKTEQINNEMISTEIKIENEENKEEILEQIEMKQNKKKTKSKTINKEKEKKPKQNQKEKKEKEKREKKYVCEVCGHTCNTNGAYHSHIKIHNPNATKYECPECGKKFKRMSEVRRHQKSHTGEKNFVCPHKNCGRSFMTKQYLEKHIQSHKTNISYQCTYRGCEKAFFMKTELIAHVQEEHKDMSGSKKGAFCCPHEGCKRVFEFPSHLYKHCAAQHQQCEHVCCFDGCYEVFDREELLFEHITSVHNMDPKKYHEEKEECPKCGVVVLKRAMQQHMRKAHTEKSICFRDDGQIVTDDSKRWFNC